MDFQYENPNDKQEEKKQEPEPQIVAAKEPEDEDEEEIEDEEENERLRVMILRYKSSQRFSAHFKECKIKFDGIEDMTHAQLQILLNKIKINLNNKTNGNITNSLIMAGIEKSEILLTTMGICDLTGLTDELKSNDVFLDSLEEIIIESNLSFQFKDPKKKLAFELFKSAYMIHTINKMKKFTQPPINVGGVSNDLC